jgi:hypothetical protein
LLVPPTATVRVLGAIVTSTTVWDALPVEPLDGFEVSAAVPEQAATKRSAANERARRSICVLG